MKQRRTKSALGLLAVLAAAIFVFACGETPQTSPGSAGGADTAAVKKAEAASESPEPEAAGREVTFSDTVMSVPTDEIYSMLDEMKTRLAAKEASLAEREAEVLKKMKQASNLRTTAWIVLVIGVLLCVAGGLMIYRGGKRSDQAGAPEK